MRKRMRLTQFALHLKNNVIRIIKISEEKESGVHLPQKRKKNFCHSSSLTILMFFLCLLAMHISNV